MTRDGTAQDGRQYRGRCYGHGGRLHVVAALCLALSVLGVHAGAARLDDDPYARRELSARRSSTTKNGQPVAHQTRFWLGYDDTAIYIAFHCLDPEPDKLVMRETKRDGRVRDDDHVELELDPFHTHAWDDFSAFRITARGTQESEIGSGRSGKTEWKGDWHGAAKVVEDGWIAEMSIPWNILSYPSSDEPRTLGFNVGRHHAQLKMSSRFSNIGPAWRNQYAANWVGAELPEGGFSPELLALPFVAAGAAERDDDWEGTARGGLDVRYRPTPMLTGVLTFNPDFQNVQGEVEGIDFSRGERRVDETRPFFQEGDNVFDVWSPVGRYFYIHSPDRARRSRREGLRKAREANESRPGRDLRLRGPV